MPPPRVRHFDTLLTAAIFIVVFAFRFLTLGALENDHFVILARAHQLFHGDLPVRDFEDPGMPLGYLLSAGAAAVFGPTLLTEAVLQIALLALAAAITFRLAQRAAGSRVAGLLAVPLCVFAQPRLYNGPKIVVSVVAVALAWRYADAPSTRRLLALAGWTTVAFLFRHDYALYLGASTLALLATAERYSARAAARNAVWYGSVTVLLATPWLVYVEWADSLAAYVRSAIGFSRSEAARTFGGWPSFDLSQGLLAPPAMTAVVFYGLLALAAASVVGAWTRRDGNVPGRGHVSFASVLLMLIVLAFLRDDLAARAADVTPVAAIVGAWLAGRLIPPRAFAVGAGATALVLFVTMAVGLAARGYSLPTPGGVYRHTKRISGRLLTAAHGAIPDARRTPLIEYLARCTGPADRILVIGFAPELPPLASRAFAGRLPTWVPGYYESPSEQERAVARLRQESVPIVVVIERNERFADSWPLVGRYLETLGYSAHAWPEDGIELRVRDGGRPVDSGTGLPCPVPAAR